MFEMSRPKNRLFLRIMIYSLGKYYIRKTALYNKRFVINPKQIIIYMCYYVFLIQIWVNKNKMSLQKLPRMSKPLFKNMIEKQQISHRMQIHKQRIDKVHSSKSKFTIDLDRNPNQTYKELFEENPKKNYMLQTKYMQIQRQNKFLFQKISKAHKQRKNKKNRSPDSLQRVASMNITMRRKQIEQIQIQNVKLLNRISRQKASISFKDVDKEYIKKRKFSQKLSKIQKYKLEDWY